MPSGRPALHRTFRLLPATRVLRTCRLLAGPDVADIPSLSWLALQEAVWDPRGDAGVARALGGSVAGLAGLCSPSPLPLTHPVSAPGALLAREGCVRPGMGSKHLFPFFCVRRRGTARSVGCWGMWVWEVLLGGTSACGFSADFQESADFLPRGGGKGSGTPCDGSGFPVGTMPRVGGRPQVRGSGLPEDGFQTSQSPPEWAGGERPRPPGPGPRRYCLLRVQNSMPAPGSPQGPCSGLGLS